MVAKETSSVSGFARSTFSTYVEKGRYDGECPFSNEVGEGASTGRMRSLWPHAIALPTRGMENMGVFRTLGKFPKTFVPCPVNVWKGGHG